MGALERRLGVVGRHHHDDELVSVHGHALGLPPVSQPPIKKW